MKHQDWVRDIREYLGELTVVASPEQVDLLARHLQLVADANQRVNLTRLIEPRDTVRLHTGDSLTILGDVADGPPGRMVDMGSGAGFPGLPLAIMTGRSTVLLDSVGKKVRELATMIVDLGLSDSVTARASRAEALARAEPAGFAIVTARALAELPAIVELASPLMQQGGVLVCMKGNPSRSEAARGRETAAIVGMEQEAIREFDLPGGAGHRTVIIYRKTGSPTVPLPRREGLAQHNPLA